MSTQIIHIAYIRKHWKTDWQHIRMNKWPSVLLCRNQSNALQTDACPLLNVLIMWSHQTEMFLLLCTQTKDVTYILWAPLCWSYKRNKTTKMFSFCGTEMISQCNISIFESILVLNPHSFWDSQMILFMHTTKIISVFLTYCLLFIIYIFLHF